MKEIEAAIEAVESAKIKMRYLIERTDEDRHHLAVEAKTGNWKALLTLNYIEPKPERKMVE